MTLAPHSLIAGSSELGGGDELVARRAADGAVLAPTFRSNTSEELEAAIQAAHEAFDEYRSTSPADRAAFLERIAAEIEADKDEIIARAHEETGLPVARLTGEVGRTTGQLRLFAKVVAEGSWHGARVDEALPDRAPLPRADIRQRKIPLGPVAVFGASNFPLAFSTAGGDTASALASGSPVVVKAHSGHLGTAALVGHAIARAVEASGLPSGVFSQLYGSGRVIGQGLVADPRIKAVGFTGSRSGGLALVRVAQQRAEPIPVYAEMSSVNPVFVLSAALAADPAKVAADYVGSLTLGSGQFCTNPGVVLVPSGESGDAFLAEVGTRIAAANGQTMLTSGIGDAYREGVAEREASGATVVARGQADTAANAPAPIVFSDAVEAFGEALEGEIFGAAGLVLRYDGTEQLREFAEQLEGQLTATVLAADADADEARALLPVLERKVGRILFNGWPTGVEVGYSMVHGGPYPATSDARSTSVGALAIERFLRPVAYQDVPDALLPEALRDANEWGVPRMVEGRIQLPAKY
ncbi:aldehyde dehydrogenase (NADP(+)) [Pseudoclavibacter sp. RFBI5]|uniref:aldehyde dehydrogenase (NADP(+)) n=1 Tax=Pseudoclavibacter sp. RFBI5 TaxID=2080578 RepID=UPI000CE7AF4A|nr:aldehyde dehydrogenase (NADP(+)) [Pseudoclavibacter sp. RFBI5]PPG02309.1 aldehyde dehydrogenase (NADP(+)) [Pseudoclavibacter sp. RFBI5]